MARHFFSKVAGVSLRQAVLASMGGAEWLTLRPEPENPADKNAIAVFRSNGQQLGYLSADLAESLGKQVKQGFNFAVLAVEVTGRDKANLGCNIQVFVREPGDTEDAFRAYVEANVEDSRQAWTPPPVSIKRKPQKRKLGFKKVALGCLLAFLALCVGLGVLGYVLGP